MRVPRRLANELMCERLVASYGLAAVAAVPGFDDAGVLVVDRRKDFIFPVRRGKLIARLAFYTVREMEKWERKAA